MKVKELIAVSEVEEALSKEQESEKRRPEAGFWVEKRAGKGEEGRL